MKNLKLIGFLVIMASSLMFIQCTSEPIMGPQGLAGIDGTNGTDGTNGVNGVDGTASCVVCHNTKHREAINTQFASSVHAKGGTWERGASASCAQCHGNEGYIDYINTGAVNAAGYTGVITPISCTTCHEKHGTFDFVNDGHDFALRNMEPVTLVIDDATVVDFGNSSNNCITCHQPRNSYAIPGPTADYLINSKRFGPHHGPQATVLQGIMGANIAGSATYPAAGNATHRTGSSCTKCHMGAASADKSQGAHTFNINTANCNITCHSQGVPTDVKLTIDDTEMTFTEGMKKLHDLLVTNNYISEGGYVLGNDGLEIANNGSNAVTVSAKVAQVIWNYKTLEEDLSKGVHNPDYTKALLKNSIEALK